MLADDISKVAKTTEAADTSLASEHTTNAPAVKKQTINRLYFVRYPKPADSVSTEDLQKKKDDIDKELKKINDEAAPILAERAKLAQQIVRVRDNAQSIKELIDDHQYVLDPHIAERKAAREERLAQRKERDEIRQAGRKAREEEMRAEMNKRQKTRNDFQNDYGHLGVTNDSEIDSKIATLEFKQQHESMSINEEKQLVKHIKELQNCREAVRKYSEWLEQDKLEREARTAEAKQRRADVSSKLKEVEKSVDDTTEDNDNDEQLKQLQLEINKLWDDYKSLLDQRKKLQDEDAPKRLAIDKLFKSRDTLRKERDAIWDQIQDQRLAVREANKPFSSNRAFSGKIRDMVKRGEVDEAFDLCKEQSQEMIEKYIHDSSFMNEYNRMWDSAVQYKRPLLTVSISDSVVDTATSVIAEALEAAKRQIADQQNKSSLSLSSLAKETSTTSANLLSKRDTPETESTFNVDEAATQPKPKKKAARTIVPLPDIDNAYEFEPPMHILNQGDKKSLSEVEKKKLEQEKNRLLSQEAEERKARRRQNQEKRKISQQRRAMEQEQNKNKSTEDVSEKVPVQQVDTPVVAASPSNDNNASTRQKQSSSARNVKPLAQPKAKRPLKKKSWAAVAEQYARYVAYKAIEHPLIAAATAIAVVVTPMVMSN